MVLCKINPYKKQVCKEFFSILFPTIISMATCSIYCLADVYFVGIGVGNDGLAGLNIALPLFTVFTSIGLLIGVGTTTTISIFQGEGNTEQTDRVFTIGIVANLIFGISMTVIGTIFTPQIATILGADSVLLPYVVEYLRPVLFTSFLYILSSTLQVIIRADKNPKLVMMATVGGNIVNIVFDYVFVIVFGMGMLGASLATAIGPVFSVSVLLIHFKTGKNTLYIVKDFWNKKLAKRIFLNGVGTGILELSSGIVIFMFNIVLLRISGASAVAFFAVISNIGYVAKGMFSGIAQSAQPLISRSYGKKRMDIVAVAFEYSLVVASLFSVSVYILLLIFPTQILSIFMANNIENLGQNIIAMGIYFSSLAFTGINTMLMYYFQSIEKSKYTMSIAVLRGIILVAVSLVTLPQVLGINGVWVSLTVAELLTTLIFYPAKIFIDKKAMNRFAIKTDIHLKTC